MMFAKLSILLIASQALSISAEDFDSSCGDSDQIIEEVNNASTTWKAGRNFGPGISCEYIKGMLGSLKMTPDMPKGPRTLITYSGTELPAEFDARKQWSNCPTVSSILDQANCGSCWAVAVASTFSDRMCIAANGQFTLPMSPDYLMSCGGGYECEGGYPTSAWEYIRTNGIVTGGGYHSGIGCQPYVLAPCEHFGTNGTLPPCGETAYGPECQNNCTNPNYKTSFANDLKKVTRVNSYTSIESVQEDIMKNGPVSAGFTVYADFVHYKSGVYQYTSGEELGGHAVRVLGWGTENGTPYWLVANSWNKDWGDKGTFKIKRGTDECGFEDEFLSGSAVKQ